VKVQLEMERAEKITEEALKSNYKTAAVANSTAFQAFIKNS